jgi:hypothetical protein
MSKTGELTIRKTLINVALRQRLIVISMVDAFSIE